ncbi:MAG: hypothetical protein WCP18_00090 [bacterium]
MDNRRRNIIIALVVVFIILIALILWLMLRKPAPAPVVLPPVVGSIDLGAELNNQLSNLPSSSPQRLAQEKNYPLGLKQLAFSFAERLGTYSSDAGLNNFIELRKDMTSKMQSTANQMAGAVKFSPNTFESFDTKALSANLLLVDAVSAKVTVSVQQKHTIGTSTSMIYPNLSLSFLKSGDKWLVDTAKWQ